MKYRIIKVVALMAVFTALTAGAVLAGDDDDDNEVKFTGTITSLPSTPGFIGDWIVSGRIVHVTSRTEIDQEDGVIAVGTSVKVEGLARSDGSIDAEEIEVRDVDDDDDDDDNEFEFVGTIQSLPSTPGFIGDWMVGGRIVHVTSATRIEQEDGPVAVGAAVKVEGSLRPNGSIDARKIETRQVKTNIKFTGIIESLPAVGFIGDWRVGGRVVHVTSATRIDADEGPVAIGALVEVEGTQRADGSIDASKIEVEENEAELKGTVESLPSTSGFIGDWRVAGRTVHVTAATRIDQQQGPVVVGALVEVKGRMRADGSIDATRIEVERRGPGEGDHANFKGTVQALPAGSLIGDWMVSGRLVHVVSSTRLKTKHGGFAVGVPVKVKGITMGDGSTIATMIQVRN